MVLVIYLGPYIILRFRAFCLRSHSRRDVTESGRRDTLNRCLQGFLLWGLGLEMFRVLAGTLAKMNTFDGF